MISVVLSGWSLAWFTVAVVVASASFGLLIMAIACGGRRSDDLAELRAREKRDRLLGQYTRPTSEKRTTL